MEMMQTIILKKMEVLFDDIYETSVVMFEVPFDVFLRIEPYIHHLDDIGDASEDDIKKIGGDAWAYVERLRAGHFPGFSKLAGAFRFLSKAIEAIETGKWSNERGEDTFEEYLLDLLLTAYSYHDCAIFCTDAVDRAADCPKFQKSMMSEIGKKGAISAHASKYARMASYKPYYMLNRDKLGGVDKCASAVSSAANVEFGTAKEWIQKWRNEEFRSWWREIGVNMQDRDEAINQLMRMAKVSRAAAQKWIETW